MPDTDTNESEGTVKEESVKKGDWAKLGILGLGLVIGILIGVAVGAFILPQIQCFSAANALTPEEAGAKTVEFISNYGGLPLGVDVELINVTEAEDANLYKITFNLSLQGITQTAESYMTKDGKILFPQGIDMEEFEENLTQESKQETTIGDFIVSGDELCMEDGKPIIYLFGADWCGACKWEHPVIENVTSKFTGYISFHDVNIDSNADGEIFAKYSTGGYIPTIVLGCKYYRVGPGTTMDEYLEAKVLTALICDLTGNNPVEVCSAPEIEELINEIE